jgi:hypothetical protein
LRRVTNLTLLISHFASTNRPVAYCQYAISNS